MSQFGTNFDAAQVNSSSRTSFNSSPHLNVTSGFQKKGTAATNGFRVNYINSYRPKGLDPIRRSEQTQQLLSNEFVKETEKLYDMIKSQREAKE